MNCSGIGSVPGRVRRAPTPRSTRCAACAPACPSSCATAPCRAASRASSFSIAIGLGVALGRRQPDRPGPHALGAERERGRDLASGPDAAGREHRRGRDRVDHVGHEDQRRHVAGVAAGLATLGDDDVDALVHLLSACCTLPHSAATFTPCSCARSTTSLGGGPSAFTSSLIGCSSAISHLLAALLVHPAEQRPRSGSSSEQLRHVVLGEQLVDPVAVLLRDHLLELLAHALGVELAGALVRSPASRRRRRRACRRRARRSSSARSRAARARTPGRRARRSRPPC